MKQRKKVIRQTPRPSICPSQLHEYTVHVLCVYKGDYQANSVLIRSYVAHFLRLSRSHFHD